MLCIELHLLIVVVDVVSVVLDEVSAHGCAESLGDLTPK
jgi:hypothetical protein